MSKTRYCNMLAISLAAALQAAVPTEWQVRVGPRATVYQAERYHGDALALRATLTSGGAPLAYQGSARLYAQTNGMDALWWDLADVTVSNNVLSATWLPEYDTGADVVDMFLGSPSNYQAHARIRFLPSPGPVPNSLPLPVPVLDFATVELRNISALTNGWNFGGTPGDYAAVSNAAMSAAAKTEPISDGDGEWIFDGLAIRAYNAQSTFNLVDDTSVQRLFYDHSEGRWEANGYYGLVINYLAYLSDLAAAAKAATNYTDAATNAVPRDFLPLAGGTMRGDIDMGGSYGGADADPADSAFLKFIDWWIGNGVLGNGFGIYQRYDTGIEPRYLFNGQGWLDELGDRHDVMTREDLSGALVAATNYTDEAIAVADTTYRRTVGVTNINQSVQYVSITDAAPSTLQILLPTNGETKDWLVYVSAATNVTISLPPATWWMADVAYTNAVPGGTPTALWFSQVSDGIYILGRQELTEVQLP